MSGQACVSVSWSQLTGSRLSGETESVSGLRLGCQLHCLGPFTTAFHPDDTQGVGQTRRQAWNSC